VTFELTRTERFTGILMRYQKQSFLFSFSAGFFLILMSEENHQEDTPYFDYHTLKKIQDVGFFIDII
jgi:hypothetical protein